VIIEDEEREVYALGEPLARSMFVRDELSANEHVGKGAS